MVVIDYNPKPDTNADRIRSMTDEDLARQLVNEQIVACASLIKCLGDEEMLLAYVEEVKNAKQEMIREKMSWLKIEVKE